MEGKNPLIRGRETHMDNLRKRDLKQLFLSFRNILKQVVQFLRSFMLLTNALADDLRVLELRPETFKGYTQLEHG